MLASCSLENFDCVPRDALEPSQFKGLVHLMRSASSGSRKRSSVFHQLQWWKSSLISRRLAITQPSPSQHAGQRLCVQDRYNSLLVFKFLRSTLYPRVGPLLENRERYRISWTFHGFSTDEVEDHLEIARQTWYDLHNASSISAYSKTRNVRRPPMFPIQCVCLLLRLLLRLLASPSRAQPYQLPPRDHHFGRWERIPVEPP